MLDAGGPLGKEATATAALTLGALFETAQADVLAVADAASGEILGVLGEAHVARRYADALDMAARGVLDGL